MAVSGASTRTGRSAVGVPAADGAGAGVDLEGGAVAPAPRARRQPHLPVVCRPPRLALSGLNPPLQRQRGPVPLPLFVAATSDQGLCPTDLRSTLGALAGASARSTTPPRQGLAAAQSCARSSVSFLPAPTPVPLRTDSLCDRVPPPPLQRLLSVHDRRLGGSCRQ